MIIPAGKTYAARTRGECLKIVTCEGCGQNYGFILRRTASGSASTFALASSKGKQALAAKRAAQNLDRKLLRDLDLVWCPTCGRYQKQMISRRKREIAVCGVVTLLSAQGAALMWLLQMTPSDPLRTIAQILLYVFPTLLGLLIFALVWWSPNRAAQQRVGTSAKHRGLLESEVLAQLAPPQYADEDHDSTIHYADD